MYIVHCFLYMPLYILFKHIVQLFATPANGKLYLLNKASADMNHLKVHKIIY